MTEGDDRRRGLLERYAPLALALGGITLAIGGYQQQVGDLRHAVEELRQDRKGDAAAMAAVAAKLEYLTIACKPERPRND